MLAFKYDFEIIRDGEVIERFSETNLIPTEGKDHILSVVCNGGGQVSAWYLGIYEGDYTPLATVTAATLNGLATESSAYTSGTRPAWVEAAPSSGVITNAASPAEFAMNANKTIFGCFLSSASAKGSTSGVLLSVVRFSTSKTLISGDTLRVVSPITLT